MKVDLSYLKEMSGGDRSLVLEMIDIFNDQVDEFADNLDLHLGKKEYELLGKLAHKAKSSISIMGLNDLAKDLKRLELDAKAGVNIADYPVIVDKFKEETKIAVRELDDVKNNMDLYF